MDDNRTDVLVIGGGAAGMTAALAAAEAGARVTLLEKDDRIGRKILATGNGRCNLSNTAIAVSGGFSDYNHPGFVGATLTRYDCEALREKFGTYGLLTVSDAQGWVFPRTRWANSVLDVLLGELSRVGVTVRRNEKATGVTPLSGGGFRVETDKGGLSSTSVVLTCGGGTLGGFVDGQPVIASRSILGPLSTDADSVKGLDGVRSVCRVSVREDDGVLARETGEVLFRSYGVSGIVIFDLSRYARTGQELSLDFLPELSEDALPGMLAERRAETLGGFFAGMLHTRIASALLRRAGLRETDPVDEEALARMAPLLKDYRLTLTAEPERGRAQVMRGGFATGGFDPLTLGSTVHPGLYAAGECLDIDGPCGGYNLHWAFASGLVAGEASGRGA